MNEQVRDAIEYISAVKDTLMAQSASEEIGSLSEIGKQIDNSKSILENFLKNLENDDIDEIDKIQIRAEVELGIQNAEMILEVTKDEIEPNDEFDDIHDELETEKVEDVQAEEPVETTDDIELDEINIENDLKEPETENIEETQEIEEVNFEEISENQIETESEENRENEAEMISEDVDLSEVTEETVTEENTQLSQEIEDSDNNIIEEPKEIIENETSEEVEVETAPEEIHSNENTVETETIVYEMPEEISNGKPILQTIQIAKVATDSYKKMAENATRVRNVNTVTVAQKCAQISRFNRDKISKIFITEKPKDKKIEKTYNIENHEINERV